MISITSPPQPKVAIVHVPYRHPGGEESYCSNLDNAYQHLGYTTVRFPSEYSDSEWRDATTSLRPSKDQIRAWDNWMSHHQPTLFHLNNIYPRLGPSFLRWLKTQSQPAIMTVHNHRLFCTNGLALRHGTKCMDCLKSRAYFRPLIHNCNGSIHKSTYYSIALSQERISHLFADVIDHFIAPSPYIQDLVKTLGFQKPCTHIVNPVQICNMNHNERSAQNNLEQHFDIVFAGRLSLEKGVTQLIKVAERMPHLRIALIGSGPLDSQLHLHAKKIPNLNLMGQLTPKDVGRFISTSRIGVLPSICNEILPTFALECFTLGKRCVLPAKGSTEWLCREPYFGIGCNPFSVESICNSLELGLNLATPTDQQVKTFSNRFTVSHYAAELKKVVSQAIASRIGSHSE